MRYVLTNHARKQMQERDVPADIVDKVFYYPEQVVEEEEGLKAYQSRFEISVFGRTPKLFLVRLIVNDDEDPAVIVTIYPTTQISKYWR